MGRGPCGPLTVAIAPQVLARPRSWPRIRGITRICSATSTSSHSAPGKATWLRGWNVGGRGDSAVGESATDGLLGPEAGTSGEDAALVNMENGEKLVIGKRCYVGNLAWRTSWQDLKDEFRKYGNVVYANVMRTEDGRSKGWGIVEFEHPEEALKAVETMNGVEIGGRPIMVREDREDRDVKQYNSAGRNGGGYGDQSEQTPRSGGDHMDMQVVVHGLPFKYTWRELKDLFNDKIGGVVHAEVVYGRDGRSRGYGTVRFDSAEAAKKAIDEINNADLDGRRLGVKMDKYA